jgi:ubiquitin carboxyl-terminal hydrolase 14
MMIGTADEIVKAPEKGPVFVEDLPEEEQVVALVHTQNLFCAYPSYYILLVY